MAFADYPKRYQRWTAGLRARPALVAGLTAVNKALTLLGYIAYPLLLVLLAVSGSPLLLRCVVVPALGFVLVTGLRILVNEPRPYQTPGFDPLITKDTQGKSFPSRHAFSLMMIALSWLWWLPPVGAVFVIASCGLGVIRVLGGVHYPHDVLAGMAIALVFALVGFWVL